MVSSQSESPLICHHDLIPCPLTQILDRPVPRTVVYTQIQIYKLQHRFSDLQGDVTYFASGTFHMFLSHPKDQGSSF